MKIRILVAAIILALLVSVVGVSAQEPAGPSSPRNEITRVVPEADGPNAPLIGTWNQWLAGVAGTWGTRWEHRAATGARYGVWGEADSVDGRGVLGFATSPTGDPFGVWGYAVAPLGYGVLGQNNATTGSATGVYGYSNSASGGRAVLGLTRGGTGFNYSVWGETASINGRGVLGYATATSGSAYGVWGWAGAPGARGVFGYNNAATGDGAGVFGQTNSNGYSKAVYGFAPRTTGTTYGVWGENYSSGAGTLGWYKKGFGFGRGVWGYTSSPDGWAGYFSGVGGGVYINTPTNKWGLFVDGGDFRVDDGTKSAAVNTADGKRLLYSEEATEVWFADYGFGKLTNGEAAIAIDPIFAQTVNLDVGYHVFLQAYGDAEIYVSNRSANQFEVKARDGAANVEFSYRLVGKRLGFEGERLELAPWPGEDVSLDQGALSAPDGGLGSAPAGLYAAPEQLTPSSAQEFAAPEAAP